MAYKTGAKGNNSDFGLTGAGPGKGDKDRTSDREKFLENYEDIFWLSKSSDHLRGFVKRGTKLIKKYS